MKDDYCHNGEENFNIYYRINQLDIDEKKWKRISKKKGISNHHFYEAWPNKNRELTMRILAECFVEMMVRKPEVIEKELDVSLE